MSDIDRIRNAVKAASKALMRLSMSNQKLQKELDAIKGASGNDHILNAYLVLLGHKDMDSLKEELNETTENSKECIVALGIPTATLFGIPVVMQKKAGEKIITQKIEDE